MSQNQKDLLSTLSNQLWRLISGPLTILLIPIFLTEVDQGYWYLFGGISALSIFADLGFSNIILQFSAHEFAFLSFNSQGILEGDANHLKRLGSFLRFTIKWLISICLIVFPIIYLVGIWFFTRDDVLNIYLLPWTIFSLGSLINFFNNSILSYLEGMNQIAAIQKIRFYVAIINTVVVTTLLIIGGNIYALAFGLFLSSLSIFFFIFGKFKITLTQVLNVSKEYAHSWKKEILPLFTKYAISFSSGYFIFQIYTPLMQYFHGPVQSGKIGITLSLVIVIFSLSNIWIYTITPRMNILVSQGNREALDILFRKRLYYSLLTYLIISLGLFCFLVIFKDFWIIPNIISRFLPLQSVLMLVVCYFLQLLINSWATYLRAHKKEPYMLPSVIVAIWITFATAYIGHNFKPELFFFGFLSSYLWWIPIAYIIFKRFQRIWHE